MKSNFRWAGLWRWTGVIAVALACWFGGQRSGEARLYPYYVVRSAGERTVKPRVLFVLDTSGSMGFRAAPGDQNSLPPCRWEECEDPGRAGTIDESRIAVARRVISGVVESSADLAKFALMTFDQHGPHNPNPAPAKCSGDRRFSWVTYYHNFGPWFPIQRDTGVQGAWRLCQGNEGRPYPYLRYDELGVGSVIASDGLTGDIPPSPLISTALGDIGHSSNAYRRVQWFPRFMGIRARLDSSTDPEQDILDATTGDYDRATEVWGHDFYYWPYVDGFPGYGTHFVWPYDAGADTAGVMGYPGATNAAKLYAPFYLDLSDTSVNPNFWGPPSEDAAHEEVLRQVGPLTDGGVDVGGGTPWRQVIGPVVAAPSTTNGPFSHNTVASYLSFVTNVESPDVCAPTAAVLITDGDPDDPGPQLYRNLSRLRTELGVSVYVVGFFLETSEIHRMACAGAGACDGGSCGSPCDDAPADAWDTCADPANPGSGCAWVADSADGLLAALNGILEEVVQLDIDTGQGAVVNEFRSGPDPGETEAIQTEFDAYTEYPGWRGHVTRSYCDTRDADGNLLAQCTPLSPEFDEVEETFGPCGQSREWDAGVCLRDMAWNDRRVWSYTAQGAPYRITDELGAASETFENELQSLGLISDEAQADEIAAFILGRDAPGGWKLPGLADNAPVVVRRIPRFNSATVPEVPIRDPHCGGRGYPVADTGALPPGLVELAERAWDPDAGVLDSPSEHYEYQEAVLVGDDMGVLHAFQLDSGNELWGLLPRELLASAVEQAGRGPANMGQPSDVEEHSYGIASTLNHGWVFDPGDESDESDDRWRHLGVLGYGIGGTDYLALELSHMSPASPSGPFEVVWRTEDPTRPTRTASYDALLGETWARPALSYHVGPGDSISNVPRAKLLMGSGYATGASTSQGRALMRVDAVTGDIDPGETALLPAVAHPTYEGTFGALVDPAVGSHCISRFWAEMQEVYITDPAGRLFRWDQGRETGHAADSGGPWGGDAAPVTTFWACEGAGDSCTVSPSNRGEPFAFPPAITSADRIDDTASGGEVTERDRFLVALISGSPNESTIGEHIAGANFHSSLYLLVDDHTGEPGEGFSIPGGNPKSAEGPINPGDAFTDDPAYLRVALSDVVRTRRVVPYAGAGEIVETRRFLPGTRPIRAPRIWVTGVADEVDGEPVSIEGIEVVYVTYTVYEPADGTCDPAFYDPSTETWYPDRGSTFELTFRLTSDAATGFDFTTGSTSDAVDFGTGFERGLALASVEQVVSEDCPSGNCGPRVGNPDFTACENAGPGGGGETRGAYAVPLRTNQVTSFDPIE